MLIDIWYVMVMETECARLIATFNVSCQLRSMVYHATRDIWLDMPKRLLMCHTNRVFWCVSANGEFGLTCQEDLWCVMLITSFGVMLIVTFGLTCQYITFTGPTTSVTTWLPSRWPIINVHASRITIDMYWIGHEISWKCMVSLNMPSVATSLNFYLWVLLTYLVSHANGLYWHVNGLCWLEH